MTSAVQPDKFLLEAQFDGHPIRLQWVNDEGVPVDVPNKDSFLQGHAYAVEFDARLRPGEGGGDALRVCARALKPYAELRERCATISNAYIPLDPLLLPFHEPQFPVSVAHASNAVLTAFRRIGQMQEVADVVALWARLDVSAAALRAFLPAKETCRVSVPGCGTFIEGVLDVVRSVDGLEQANIHGFDIDEGDISKARTLQTMLSRWDHRLFGSTTVDLADGRNAESYHVGEKAPHLVLWRHPEWFNQAAVRANGMAQLQAMRDAIVPGGVLLATFYSADEAQCAHEDFTRILQGWAIGAVEARADEFSISASQTQDEGCFYDGWRIIAQAPV